MVLAIIVFIIAFLFLYFDPFIDIDRNDQYVLWLGRGKKRKYFILKWRK